MSTSITTSVITVDYAENALTYNINKLNRETLLPGITKGGLLTRIADNQVSIAPFTALFQMDYGTSPVHKLLVKVYNPSSISVNVTESQPYVVMSMSWVREEDNYPIADIKSEAEVALLDNSYIIVGKVPFTAGVIDNPATFDYTRVTRGFLYNSNPDSRLKLISRVGIESGTTISEDQDVINKKYLDENADIGTKPVTQIPFGQGTNIFAYSTDFIWNNTTKILTLNGNINLNDPTSDDEVGDRGYMDARYFDGTEQTTLGLTNRMPLYDGTYKYTTINTIRKTNIYSVTSGTYVIQTTDAYTDYDFIHSATTPLLQATLPDVSANNGKTIRFTNVGTTSGFSQINGDSTDILLGINILSSLKLFMLGDYVELRSNGTYWIVKHININMITNWINRTSTLSEKIGSAFTYDTKSNSGVSWTGQHITEATSNQTAIVIYDEQTTGTTGKLYVYNIAVGTGVWTNNRVVTAGFGGATLYVNEASGSSLNIDYNIYHLLGINYNYITKKLFVDSSASFYDAHEIASAWFIASDGYNIEWGQYDINSIFCYMGSGGLRSMNFVDGSTIDLSSANVYYNICLQVRF